MIKNLYYIECTCIKDCSFPNVKFHIGDVLYFNQNAQSNEMYLYSHNKPYMPLTKEEKESIPYIWKHHSHLPFTRKIKNAKKWQIKRYPEFEASIINDIDLFKTEIKTIKISYTEEIE